MKKTRFSAFLSHFVNRHAAASEVELAQILHELELVSTSSDPGAREEPIAKIKDFLERHPERVEEIQRVVAHK
jgi:hypothetical protein